MHARRAYTFAECKSIMRLPTRPQTLNGAFIYMADLCRAIAPLPDGMELDFLRASSYLGASTTSEEAVSLGLVSKIPVAGRHVLVVEDIVDTGLTLQVRVHCCSSTEKRCLLMSCSVLRGSTCLHAIIRDRSRESQITSHAHAGGVCAAAIPGRGQCGHRRPAR